MLKNRWKIITKREIIRNVRERWLKQYKNSKNSDVVGIKKFRKVGEIRANLEKLDLETCSENDVNAAIGVNASWASLICDGCHQNSEIVIRIGDAPDYDSRWQDLCIKCISEAKELMQNVALRKKQG